MSEQDRELAFYQEQIAELTKYRERAQKVLVAESAANMLPEQRKRDLEGFVQIASSALDSRFEFGNRRETLSELIFRAIALGLSKQEGQ